MFIERHQSRDSPEDPVVKTPSFEGKGEGLIPGWGTKIPHGLWCGQKKKKKTLQCYHVILGILCFPEFLESSNVIAGYWRKVNRMPNNTCGDFLKRIAPH